MFYDNGGYVGPFLQATYPGILINVHTNQPAPSIADIVALAVFSVRSQRVGAH